MGKVRAFDVAFLGCSYKPSMQLLWRVVYFIGRPYCVHGHLKNKKKKKKEKFVRVSSKYIHGNSDHEAMPGKNHIHISLNIISELEAIARVVLEIYVCPLVSYLLYSL